MRQRIFAGACVVVLLAGAILASINYSSVRQLDQIVFVKRLPMSANVEKAIEIRIDQSTALTQISLLVLGGFVTLFLAKPQEAGLTTTVQLWPEYVMAITACALLLVSFCAGNSYVDRLVDALASVDPKSVRPAEFPCIPDIFDAKFETARDVQANALLLGGLFSIFPFISLRLRGSGS